MLQNSTESPLVSIVLPTLNSTPYIENCLDSIKNQTYGHIEVIVVDGGSTDGTVEYLNSYNKLDINIIHNSGGLVEALNDGLNHANGVYVARVDSDSVMHKDRLSKQVKYLNNNSEVAVVGSHANKLYEDGDSYVDQKPLTENNIKKYGVYRCPVIHPTLLMRTEIVVKLGGYKRYHWEDWELITRVVGSSDYTVANFDECLADVLKRNDSITGNTSLIQHALANLVCGHLMIARADFNRKTAAKYYILKCMYVLSKSLDLLHSSLRGEEYTETWELEFRDQH